MLVARRHDVAMTSGTPALERPPAAAVAVMVVAGALWGSTFAVPAGLPGTSPLVLTGARFGLYGVVSALVVARRGGLRGDLPWGRALAHATTGWVGMYLAEVVAIRLAGAPVTVSVLGTLPVVNAVVGARHDRVPLAPVVPSMLLALLGHLALHGGDAGVAAGVSAPALVAGVLAASLGVAGWCWFALDNADLLRSRPDIGATEWSSAVGVACAVVSVPLLVVAGLAGATTVDPLPLVAVVALYLAVGPSWLAGAAWNRAAVRLPASLAGQLIVFEPLFAFVFVSVSTGHRPGAAELVGELLLLSAAVQAVRAHVRRDQTGSKTATRSATQSARGSGSPGPGAGVTPRRTTTRSEAGTQTIL